MKFNRRFVLFRSKKSSQAIAKAQPQTQRQLLLSLLALAIFALVLFTLSGCGLSSNGEDETLNSGTSQNTISSMNVGDAHLLNFSNGLANLTFEEPNPDHHYILAITGGLSGAGISINDGSSGSQTAFTQGPQPSPKSYSAFNANPANPGDAAHLWFLDQEQIHYAATHAAINNPGTPLGQEGGGYLGLGGGNQTFKVLPPSYTLITAQPIGSGSRINVFLDTNAQPLTAQEKSELTTTLDSVAGKDISIFGSASDIDGNSRINVVLTDLLASASLSGYFWSGDLNPGDPASNAQEVVFLIAPNSSYYYGGVVPKADVLQRVLPGVLAHELQHLLNFLRKSAPEDKTINESISHVVENWVGYPHELRYKQADCLNQIDQVDLGSSSIGIPARGCGEALIQHLCEQTGNVGACLGEMVTNPNIGWLNVAQAAGDTLGNVVGKFLAGLIVTGSNLNSTSNLQFDPLGMGPGGDISNFNPFYTYNDISQTSLNGVPVDQGGLGLPYNTSVSGIASFIEITGTSSLTIQVNGSGDVGGTIIRIEDTGAVNLKKSGT